MIRYFLNTKPSQLESRNKTQYVTDQNSHYSQKKKRGQVNMQAYFLGEKKIFVGGTQGEMDLDAFCTSKYGLCNRIMF